MIFHSQHKRSPEKAPPSDSDDAPGILDLPSAPGGQVDSRSPRSEPVVHPFLRLPYELWVELASHLIAESPWIRRPGQPPLQFPIAPTMRDLGSLALGCTKLYEIVRQLRKEPRFDSWRNLGARTVYEFNKRTESARQLAMDMYAVDPAFPQTSPQLVSASVYSATQSQTLLKTLSRHRLQLRELQLLIDSNQGTADIHCALIQCVHLHRLELSTDAKLGLALVSNLTSGLHLSHLALKGASVEADALFAFAKAGLSYRLESLSLNVKDLTGGHWEAMQELVRQSPSLSFIGIAGARLALPDCQSLGQLFQDNAQLQSLSIGADGGAVSDEGLRRLITILGERAPLSSLAVHNHEKDSSTSSIIDLLRTHIAPTELVWGGQVDDLGPLCRLPSTMRQLRSLGLNHCKLDARAWGELANSLLSSHDLRELRIVGEKLPDASHDDFDLANAIQKAGNLRLLRLEHCEIYEVQAERLGKAVALNPSILVLQLLLRRSDGDGKFVTQAFARELRERGGLLQCDFSQEVCAGWTEVQGQLQHNRLIGAKPISAQAAGTTMGPHTTEEPTSACGVALARASSASLPASPDPSPRRKLTAAQKAARRHRSAAATGDPDANFQLAECHRRGLGVARDAHLAVKHYQIAAIQCHAAARYQLGLCHAKGFGITCNPAKALKWYRKASRQDYAPALWMLGLCYEKASGVAPDMKKAFECYKKAAKLGDARAQYRLGRCYAEGKGTARDAQKARQWYQTAIATRQAMTRTEQ